MRFNNSEQRRCPQCGELAVEDDRACTRCRAMALAEAGGDALAAHSERVAVLAVLVAESLELPDEALRAVELTALLHDVGKNALPREILDKPAALNDEEWELMRTHTIEGERMIDEARSFPEPIGPMVRASHERWDGGGYPDGLHGSHIPLAARVVFCADAFDAMVSPRPYRGALPVSEAVAELRRAAGRQFDPVVAEALAVKVEGAADGRAAGAARR
jgi:HD-GYP domain-containing protein (c-di-GMP phosphodiesterase class II)